MGNVRVLCDKKDCVYFINDPNIGEAYRFFCGNDEIEIGENPEAGNRPVCFSYEKED